MKTKRFLAALLAAVMTFACFATVSFAALPTGATYDLSFDAMDDPTVAVGGHGDRIWPAGWKDHTTRGVPTGYSDGADSLTNSDDKSWYFLIGYGNGGGVHSNLENSDSVNIGNSSVGPTISLGNNQIKDTTLVYDADFKVGASTVMVQFLMPVFLRETNTGTVEQRPIAVTLKDGVLTANGEVIGTMKANEWHNIGAVITHSSTAGLTIDVYLDSIKVYTYETASAQYKRAYLSYFRIPTESTALKDAAGRFDSRNEYVYIDNFYIGDDVAKVSPDFKPNYTMPASGSVVPADGDISLVMNQAIGNPDLANSIWLTSKAGQVVNFASIVPESTVADPDTLTGILGENLYYSEDYTLSVSPALMSTSGFRVDASREFTFKTDTMFPVKMNATVTEDPGAMSASLEFTGNTSAMTVVMATYDEKGAMVAASTANVSANVAVTSVSVPYADGETVKIFAVDSLSSGILVAQPVVVGETVKSYKQAGTTLGFTDVETLQKYITVDGATSSTRGWVLTKVAVDGDETSDDIADYLAIEAVQTNDDGTFRFAGKVQEVSNDYKYVAIAPDSGNTAVGTVNYVLEEGMDLLQLTLGGKKCVLRGNEFTLKVKDIDVSGLLVEFTASTGAKVVTETGEELVSGVSRVNFDRTRVFEVVAETGLSQYYTIYVDVEATSDADDRNDNFTVIVDNDAPAEGEGVVDPGEYEERVFSDVPTGYWATEAIEALYEKGIVGGKDDGTFDPNALITREEFCSMVAKAFNYSPKNTRMSFDDVVSGAWYENSVYALAENDVVAGIAKHTFGTGETITRQDMVVILYRVIMNKSIEYVREYADFVDQAKIAPYATEAVEVMYKAGFVNGFEDGTFRPTAGTTKAMAAYMIYSIMNAQ
ncbi:MAG: S-layer homology domain-containing protein [Clostridia bacterium]|nr:S-layer homology domain-containing protein [Clostridia bacterium]